MMGKSYRILGRISHLHPPLKAESNDLKRIAWLHPMIQVPSEQWDEDEHRLSAYLSDKLAPWSMTKLLLIAQLSHFRERFFHKRLSPIRVKS